MEGDQQRKSVSELKMMWEKPKPNKVQQIAQKFENIAQQKKEEAAPDRRLKKSKTLAPNLQKSQSIQPISKKPDVQTTIQQKKEEQKIKVQTPTIKQEKAVPQFKEKEVNVPNQETQQKEIQKENETSTQENIKQTLDTQTQKQSPFEQQDKKQIQNELLQQAKQANQQSFDNYLQKSTSVIKNYSQKISTKEEQSSSSDEEVKQEIKITWNQNKQEEDAKKENQSSQETPKAQISGLQSAQQEQKTEQNQLPGLAKTKSVDQIKSMFENKSQGQKQKQEGQKFEKSQTKPFDQQKSKQNEAKPEEKSQQQAQVESQPPNSIQKTENIVQTQEKNENQEVGGQQESSCKTEVERSNKVSDLISRFDKGKKKQQLQINQLYSKLPFKNLYLNIVFFNFKSSSNQRKMRQIINNKQINKQINKFDYRACSTLIGAQLFKKCFILTRMFVTEKIIRY